VPEGSYAGVRTFDELPLSTKSKRGLQAANYTTLTAIQRAALPHSLCGRDVLGAAKTGSGKTLSFLIPLVERLYRWAGGLAVADGWGWGPRRGRLGQAVQAARVRGQLGPLVMAPPPATLPPAALGLHNRNRRPAPALRRLKWTSLDGLGGLVLTPTRELAPQIFEELRKIGRQHDLSAGLLIGGCRCCWAAGPSGHSVGCCLGGCGDRWAGPVAG
jgi:hypothetical protein